jgi:hypothetical protein
MGGSIAVLLALCCSTGFAEEIPLSEVWAMDMPGTKPMNRSMRSGKFISEEGPLLEDIRNLGKGRKPNEPSPVREGFAVVGTGMEALRNAYKVLVQNEGPKDLFAVGADLSIVFFTGRSIRYIHLHDVNRNGNQIVVRYKFVPHQTLMESRHLALIPMCRLPEGKYDVIMERMPLEEQYAKAGWEDLPTTTDGLVCKSFSFTVESARVEGKP